MSRVAVKIKKMGHRLVEESRLNQAYPLLLLPSTPAAFSVVAILSGAGLPVRVVGDAARMREWAPALIGYVHSPLELWRAVKDSSTLPFVIVSFQDQLAGVDDSFYPVTIDGQRIRVSPIELMLVMRFRPRTYLATALEGGPGKASSLDLADLAVELSAHMSTNDFNMALSELFRPILKCSTNRINDWRARELFSIKVGDNFERLLSLRAQEIESLIRVYQDRHAVSPALAISLERLRASRQEFVGKFR